MCLPMSSKRSTQTTNTFVSGPSGGKDFPVDDLFVFTKGLSYRKSTKQNDFMQTLHKIEIIISAVSIQFRHTYVIHTLPFWQTPGFQNGWGTAPVWDWVVWVNQARGLCWCLPPLWSHCALMTPLGNNRRANGNSVNPKSPTGFSSSTIFINLYSREQMLTRIFCQRWNNKGNLCQSISVVQDFLLPIEHWASCVLRSSGFLYSAKKRQRLSI